MNYKQALEKLKRVQFGIVVQDGKRDDITGEFIYYVLRFKGDTELEEVTESKVNGIIVAVKSGSEIYSVDGGAEEL